MAKGEPGKSSGGERERKAAVSRAASSDAREIGPLPGVKNKARKAKGRKSA